MSFVEGVDSYIPYAGPLKDNLDILNSLVDYVIQEEEITGEEFEKVYNEALEKRKEIKINN